MPSTSFAAPQVHAARKRSRAQCAISWIATALVVAGCSHFPGAKPTVEEDDDARMNRMMDDAPDSLRDRQTKQNKSAVNGTAKAASAAKANSASPVIEDVSPKAAASQTTPAAASAKPRPSEDSSSSAPSAKSAAKPAAKPAVPNKSKRGKKARPDEIPDAADIGL